MPLRTFRVKFSDGTVDDIQADSLDEAWAKARRMGRRRISVKHQGRPSPQQVERQETPLERMRREEASGLTGTHTHATAGKRR